MLRVWFRAKYHTLSNKNGIIWTLTLTCGLKRFCYWLHACYCPQHSCTVVSWWYFYVPYYFEWYVCLCRLLLEVLHMFFGRSGTEYKKQVDEGMRKKNVIGWIWAEVLVFAEIMESKNGQDIADVQLPEC